MCRKAYQGIVDSGLNFVDTAGELQCASWRHAQLCLLRCCKYVHFNGTSGSVRVCISHPVLSCFVIYADRGKSTVITALCSTEAANSCMSAHQAESTSLTCCICVRSVTRGKSAKSHVNLAALSEQSEHNQRHSVHLPFYSQTKISACMHSTLSDSLA